MSTQIGFDIAGLTQAIERCDLDYQLALYADNAEVQVTDHRSERVYHGKSAIRDWIEHLEAQRLTHRVVSFTSGSDQVTLTDHSQYPDGRNLICQAIARVHRGQITQQVVTVTWEEVRDLNDTITSGFFGI